MKNNWTLIVFLLTFILSMIFSIIANILGNLNNIVLIIVTLLVIFIGTIFDVIGTAVLSADIKVMHSRGSQKIKGAKEAINLINKSDKVSSVCNDVIGDICGILSGGLSAILVMSLFNNASIYQVIITAVVSALTVGSKAIGKQIAIKNADNIIFNVGKILGSFTRKK